MHYYYYYYYYYYYSGLNLFKVAKPSGEHLCANHVSV